MQECLKFHVRFVDLGLFFHVLISPVNIWAERLWTEISLNMNKSACVNLIWISAFHLLKCQSRREGVIIAVGWWGPCSFKQTSSLASALGVPAFRCMALEFFFFFCFRSNSVAYCRTAGGLVRKFRAAVLRAQQFKTTVVLVFIY